MNNGHLMIIIYNIFFTLIFLLAGPYFLYKLMTENKWREGLRMRLGIYPAAVREALKDKKAVWIHAASVGEVKAVLCLVRRLQEALASHSIVVSTVTRTGYHVARESLGDSVTVIFFPLDFIFSVIRAIRMIRPVCVILVEGELWANFLDQLYRRKIPVALVNVRMSQRSFKRYAAMKFFVGRFIERLSLATCPGAREKEKMQRLGAGPGICHVVGNLKFEDNTSAGDATDVRAALLGDLGFARESRILLGGSTHPGEEEILTKIFRRLSDTHSDLRLILVPRHPERAGEILGMIEQCKLKCSLRTRNDGREAPVMIVDTIGELERLYAAADIVFIGKSLTRKGGQNFLEAARFGKCIIFGPHMENFESIAASFVEAGAACQIHDAAGLGETVRRLLASPRERAEMGERALELLSEGQGAADRTAALLRKVIQSPQKSSSYVRVPMIL